MAKDDNKDTRREELFERPARKYDSAYIKHTIDLDKILAERKAGKAGNNGGASQPQKPFVVTDNRKKNVQPPLPRQTLPSSEQDTIQIYTPSETSAPKSPAPLQGAPASTGNRPQTPVQAPPRSGAPKEQEPSAFGANLRRSLDNIVVGDVAIEEKIRKNQGSSAKITHVREFVQTSFEDHLNPNPDASAQKPPKFVISIPDEAESEFFKTDEDFSDNKSVYENVSFDEHMQKLTPEDTLTDLEFPMDEEAEEKTRTILGLLFQPEEDGETAAKIKKPNRHAKLAFRNPFSKNQAAPLHIFDQMQDTHLLQKELYHRVKSQKVMKRFAGLLLILQLAIFYISLTPTLLEFFAKSVPFLTLAQLSAGLNILLAVLCYELLQRVFWEITSVRCSYLTLSTLLLFLSVVVNLFFLPTGAPFGLYPALLFCKQYYNLADQYRKARIDSKLVLSKAEKTYPLPLEETGLFADSFGNKIKASAYFQGSHATHYFTHAFSQNATEKLFSHLFLTVFILTAWYWFIDSLGQVNVPIIYCALLSTLSVCPFNALFAFQLPYKIISKLLRRKSALIAGQDGIDALFAMDEVVFSDSDLFQDSKPLVAGIKLYGKSTFEEVVLTAASVAYYLQQPILDAFMHILDHKKEVLLPVEEAKYQDKSGIYAFLNGNVVVLGTEAFLKQNLIRLPKDNIGDKVRSHSHVPLYLAINGNLSAVFSIRYGISKTTRKAVRQLVSSGIGMLISTTDPLLNEELIEWLFDIREDFVRIVPMRNRNDVMGDATREVPVSALISSKRLSTFLRTIACAFRLKNTLLVNNLIVLLSCLFSILIGTFLIYTGNLALLTPASFLVYQLFWALPILGITAITKSICK